MGIVFVMLPLSLVLSLAGLCAYVWCVRRAQFRDPDGDARRMLFDDEEKP